MESLAGSECLCKATAMLSWAQFSQYVGSRRPRLAHRASRPACTLTPPLVWPLLALGPHSLCSQPGWALRTWEPWGRSSSSSLQGFICKTGENMPVRPGCRGVTHARWDHRPRHRGTDVVLTLSKANPAAVCYGDFGDD